MPSRKATISEREIKRYRRRLSRTVGLYLALFAWKTYRGKGLDQMSQTAPRLRLFASLVEEMPKQKNIIADLALFTAGVATPKIKVKP